jgi:hypothetical protein
MSQESEHVRLLLLDDHQNAVIRCIQGHTLNCRQSTFGSTLIDICFVAPVDVEQLEQVYSV